MTFGLACCAVEMMHAGASRYDWQPGASVRLVAIDEQTGETTEKNVTLHDLVTALPIANKQVYMDLLDLDNYDAVCGDAILQVAVLGEVVYG
jgi:hypothetical protein